MSELARAVGVTPVIIYRHFDSKENLYRTLVAQIADRYRDSQVFAPADSGVTVDVSRVLAAGRADPDAFRLFWQHAARESAFGELPAALRAEAVEAIAASLKLHAEDATLTHWAAQAAIGYVIETVLTWLEFGDPAQDFRFCDATTAAMNAGVDAWSNP
jgi:AcrR family transcriptional regulator